MKTIKLIALILAFAPLGFFAQDDTGIEISTAAGSSDLAQTYSSLIENKLGSLLAQNGIVRGINSQFEISTDFNVLNTKTAGGAPPMYIYEIMFTTKIMNIVDKNTYAQVSKVSNGVGNTLAKAVNNAINQMNFDTPEYHNFLASAKTKIVDYYAKNCSTIINEVNMLEKTNQYDFALYKLTSIPSAAKSCYSQAMAKAQAVYVKKINYECKSNLAQAKMEWSKNPNAEGAEAATAYLSQIDPSSSCFKEVETFSKSVGARMKEIDGREWNVYYEKEVGLEKDRIQAIKEIGKAFGAGQPKQVIHNTKIKL
ncbi:MULTISPECIES: hypothetical protein [Chryseobacterium]|uniref:hypothetical protein n=1 Tax=Chryseobacterium sp. R2A-55 TaxID=2744445 RepID=UPI001F48C498|nr:hypothetical protein [Chryseobacterium sp. R2A-55]